MANFRPSGISVYIRQDLDEGAARSGTTLIIDPIITADGHRVTMSDIGDICFAKIDQGTSNEEIISFTGITDNTSTYTLTGCVWGYNFYNGTGSVAANQKKHISGSKIIITNDDHFLNLQYVNVDSAQTIVGAKTFTVTPQSNGGNPTTSTDLVIKSYVDALVLGTLTTINVIVPGKAGETVSAGNLLYFDETDNEWKKTDADTASTVENVLLGIAQGAGTDGNAITNGILLQGVDSHQSGLTEGDPEYASNTAGSISSTPGTTEVTVGIAKSTTELYFNPRFNQQLTENQQDALAGTSGTPSAANPFVTNDDTAENTASKLVRRKSDGTIDGAKEQIELPAYRDLVAGDILKLINDAGVAKVDRLMGFNGSSINGLATAGGDDIAAKVFEISSNKYLLLYLQNSGSSDIATAVVVSVSGNTLSLGSPANFATGSEIGDVDAIKLEDDKVLIGYTKSATTPVSTTYAVIGTITGTSIAYGSVLTVETTSNNLSSQPSSFKSALSLLEENKVLFVFMGRDGSSWVPRTTILSISGTTVSANAITSLGGTSYAGYNKISLANLSSTKVVMLLSKGGGWTYAFTISISGTTVTLSDAESLQSFGSNNSNNIIALSDSLALVVYQSTGTTTTLYYDIISISGTTISIVSQNTITSALAGDFGLSAYLRGNLAYIYSPYDAKVWKFQVFGSSIYLKNVYTLSSLGGVNEITKSLLCFDTANNRLAFFKGYESPTRGLTVQFGYPDYDEFIGLSDATYLTGAGVQIKDVVGGQTSLITANEYGITYGGAIAPYLSTGTYQKIGRAKSSTDMLIAENN